MRRPARLFLTVRLGHDSVILKNMHVKKKERIFEYHKVINLIHQVQFSSEASKVETAGYLRARVTGTLSNYPCIRQLNFIMVNSRLSLALRIKFLDATFKSPVNAQSSDFNSQIRPLCELLYTRQWTFGVHKESVNFSSEATIRFSNNVLCN